MEFRLGNVYENPMKVDGGSKKKRCKFNARLCSMVSVFLMPARFMGLAMQKALKIQSKMKEIRHVKKHGQSLKIMPNRKSTIVRPIRRHIGDMGRGTL